jgi:hypothetical protein
MLYTGVDYHGSFSYPTTMNEKGEIIACESSPYDWPRRIVSSKNSETAT